ncbi:SDR family oxidoreductase [Lentzea sp.]|uniref:SDR family NAD(P)-dependent oxidoreductase n=1 Tax=Lentzea sp. TaxID=56099 RepID=UPI002ED1ACC3
MTIDYRGARVLVTGASAGIGAQFARELARRGADLVLVARRAERLEALAAELKGVEVTVLPCDLTEPGAVAKLATELRQRDLKLTGLINNAGFGTYGPFAEEDVERLRTEIALDISAVVELSRTFVDELVEARGILVNVASLAAYHPVPKMAVYGAAKAFVLNFTEALWSEHRGAGLKVLALSPGATSTEFFDVAGEQASAGARRVPPELVVETALRTLDKRNPPPSIAVGRANRLMLSAGRLLGRRQAAVMMGAVTAT